MVQKLIGRALLTAVVAIVMPGIASAQQAQPTPASRAAESTLLTRLAATPGDLNVYLDLAKIYAEQGRVYEAQQMLTRASTILSERTNSRTLLGATPVQVPYTPPPTPRTDATTPVRIGSDIREPKKIKDVKPAYPPIAETAGISGMVILEIVLDRNGDVRDAKVLRGIPMLNDAALDAVRQWRYTPTTLNGLPIELVMTVTVNFSLSDPSVSSAQAPVRIGGNVREPRKLKDAKPVYPSLAQAGNISGVVIMEVVIGVDGKVTDAKLLRSVPMLDQAALDAVRQWEYEPTFVNGLAVPVVMTVTLSFTLG